MNNIEFLQLHPKILLRFARFAHKTSSGHAIINFVNNVNNGTDGYFGWSRFLPNIFKLISFFS